LHRDQRDDEALTQTIIQLMKDKKLKNVQQLVNLVKGENSVAEQKIVERIMQLQSQGKIALRELPTRHPQKLSAYLKTKEALWYWSTLLLIVATTATVFTVQENAVPLVYIRYVLGTIFVLWLPGYSFIKALFPTGATNKKSSGNIDSIERTALSIGLSLALVPIVGLLLNYTPWGIRLTPIVLSLLALTTIFATAAIIREHHTKINAPTQKRH
jgi:hypothetical protein